MFLQLGKYKFEGIKLPQSWGVSYVTSFGEIPIINGKPVLQKTGLNLTEMEFSAYFNTDFCKPQDEIDQLNTSRIAGEVLQLVDGNGKNYGKFVILSVEVTNVQNLDNGYPIAITATIKIKEYNTNVTIIVNDGEALQDANPVTETPIDPFPSPGMSIELQFMIANSNTVKIINAIQKAQTFTVGMYKKVSTTAQNAKDAYDKADHIVEQAKKIVYRAQDLRQTITDCKQALSDVQAACDIHSFHDIMLANDRLSSATYNLQGANVPVVAFIGTREGGN